MKLTFTEKEFAIFRKFQDRLAKEFGDTVYAGTNSATILLEYSPKLCAMLRPYPVEKCYEFVVRQLSCKDCKKKQMFICLETETDFLCDDCVSKRKKPKVTVEEALAQYDLIKNGSIRTQELKEVKAE